MTTMKFGITDSFACSYLEQQKERLLVYVGGGVSQNADYEYLLQSGFRRSGDQVYRPHCVDCNACKSLRIAVNDFSPSKNQKRVLSKNRDITSRLSNINKPEYYDLYHRYISKRHADGSMFPPTPEQYDSFLTNNWSDTLFVELHLDNKLIAVAVTDAMEDCLSALYTFFDPALAHRSLGTHAILEQINQTRLLGKTWLYLGYQIDCSQKMNYKRKFLPNEQYIDHQWIRIQKNDD